LILTANQKLRLLLFSDTHLGFDQPLHPRIKRRRRGSDFESNLNRILDFAVSENVDFAVHCGDVFFRSRIPPELTSRIFEKLEVLPENNIPLYIVPGNHERSKIPNPLLAIRKGIHIFSSSQSYQIHKNHISVTLGGFPFNRSVRANFRELVENTGMFSNVSDFYFLCIHQAVQGAVAGAQNYIFSYGSNVIPEDAISFPVDAVLSGHIHSHQILLWKDLNGNTVPVIYPGSIERTSFAERNETKGFVILDMSLGRDGQKEIFTKFIELPARPMLFLHIDNEYDSKGKYLAFIEKKLATLPEDSIVKISFQVSLKTNENILPGIEELRTIAPETMNLSLRYLHHKHKGS